MTNTNKPEKSVLVDHEEKMSLEKAAHFLETVAKKLREEGTFTLTHGEVTHDITPSPSVTLEVKLEKTNDKNKFEVELEWYDGDKGSSLSIG